MLQPFASSHLKLKRAMRHIEELEEVISEYFTGKWFLCSTITDATGKIGFKVTFRKKPEEFAMVVGDAIHNMRSALDLAAVALVGLNKQDIKGVMFPFARNEEEFFKAMKNKNIDRASTRAQDLIKTLKPYGGGNEVLRSLHELDIQDKHHTLIPNAIYSEFPPIGVRTDEFGNPLGFDTGKLEFYMDETIPPKLQFVFPDDCPLKGQEVVPGLRIFHGIIVEIINKFESLEESKNFIQARNS